MTGLGTSAPPTTASLEALAPRLRRLADIIRELKRRRRESKFYWWNPWPKQRLIMNCREKVVAILGGNRVGKAQPLYAKILTPAGWTTMGEIKPGDRVIASNGKATEVTAIHPQGVMDVYEITFNDGEKVRCTDNHLWTVKTPESRFRKTRKDGSPNPGYGKWETVELSKIRKWMESRYARCRVEVPVVEPVEFERQELEIDPYLLGIILGDGSVGTGSCVSVTTADSQIAEFIQSQCAEWGLGMRQDGITYHMAVPLGEMLRDGTTGRMLSSNGLVQALRRASVMGCGSREKFIPNAYMRGRQEDRLAILQGLMDTDGTADARGLCTFTSTSKHLADGMAEIARSLGQVVSVSQTLKHCTYKGEKKYCTAYNVYFRKPTIKLFRLERKLARQKVYDKPTARVMQSIKLVGREECQCITVAHEDHLYVTDGYTLTHNSISGAYWLTCHLTGIYPDWWEGRRYSEPVDCWAAGETAQTTRDIVQKELLGDIRVAFGSGMIPNELIEDHRKLAGSPDAIDTVYVRHISGGLSSCGFKSMEQGRSKFQGTKKHAIWMDEEPKVGGGYDILSECRRRTMEIKDQDGEDAGQTLVTYTPLYGMSELCRYILKTDDPTVQYVNITWDDAPHLSEEERARELASMLPHEVEARTKGTPTIREGLVYPFGESQFLVEPFPVPDTWLHVAGLDIAGYGGYTAAVLMAIDPKTRTTYVIREYCEKGRTRDQHLKELQDFGDGMYFACDPSGNKTEVDGSKTIPWYKQRGINIHNAENDIDEGIREVSDAIANGRLKIFSNLLGLREEMRFYQYVQDSLGRPKPRKKDDHRLDSWRYGVMALKHARPLHWFRANAMKRQGVTNARSEWSPGDSVVGY